jgi:hypothetical protein
MQTTLDHELRPQEAVAALTGTPMKGFARISTPKLFACSNLQPFLHNTRAAGGWVGGDCRGRRQSHDEADGMSSQAGRHLPTPDFRRLMRYVAVQFNSLLLAGRDGSLLKISG